MPETIDYYFTVTSPWSYLGDARFRELVSHAGRQIDYKPVDMHAVFSVSGGLPLAERPAQRKAYRLAELRRWRDRLSVPMNIEPAYFPAPSDTAMRMVVAAKLDGAGADQLGVLVHAFMRAVWAEEKNIADKDTLQAIASDAGFDGAKLLARAQDQDTGAAYQAYTDEAITAGVFGAPTYIVDGEMFWGQDRLDFVQARLSA